MIEVPDRIDSTGKDVSAELTEWLQGVPDGSQVKGAARYRTDYGVRLQGKQDITLLPGTELFTELDKPAVLDPRRKGFRMLSFTGGGGIDIGWDITGPVPDSQAGIYRGRIYETQHGIELMAVDGARIASKIKNVNGDFVYLGAVRPKVAGKQTSIPNRDVTVEGCTCDGAGRQGMGIIAASGLKILRSTFGNVGRSLWDMESPSPNDVLEDIEIAECRITGRVSNNIVAAAGHQRRMRHITIRDNDFGPKAFRMDIKGNVDRSGLHILRNVAYEELASPRSPVEVKGWVDVEVRDNVMPMQRRNPAILLTRCGGDIQVGGNQYPGGRVELETAS